METTKSKQEQVADFWFSLLSSYGDLEIERGNQPNPFRQELLVNKGACRIKCHFNEIEVIAGQGYFDGRKEFTYKLDDKLNNKTALERVLLFSRNKNLIKTALSNHNRQVNTKTVEDQISRLKADYPYFQQENKAFSLENLASDDDTAIGFNAERYGSSKLRMTEDQAKRFIPKFLEALAVLETDDVNPQEATSIQTITLTESSPGKSFKLKVLEDKKVDVTLDIKVNDGILNIDVTQSSGKVSVHSRSL